MQKIIVNPENPNGILVDMTAEEIAQVETDKVNEQARLQAIADKRAEEETAKQAKETAQASGNQKLLDLGLSQAEATALTGYTPPSEE
jgi:hypothetical protein